ncbi:MAG: hypothetical protein ACOYVD_16015 [Bacillota bacterium]
MIFILIGCLAFFFLYIFDINKVLLLHKNLNILFAVGVLLLAFATIGVLLSYSADFQLNIVLRVFFYLLSLFSLILIPYSLFFSLPFRKTYFEIAKENTVVDTGMYALCRHPGVLWFFFFYLFLWLASGKIMVMWAGLVWTIMDIIHVYVQDRWLFPKTLIGYERYKDKVPFLIPSLCSVKKCIITIK